ncbi:hypothetical protein EsH8_XV_000024 [Colletotrichum jinshuiense]
MTAVRCECAVVSGDHSLAVESTRLDAQKTRERREEMEKDDEKKRKKKQKSNRCWDTEDEDITVFAETPSTEASSASRALRVLKASTEALVADVQELSEAAQQLRDAWGTSLRLKNRQLTSLHVRVTDLRLVQLESRACSDNEAARVEASCRRSQKISCGSSAIHTRRRRLERMNYTAVGGCPTKSDEVAGGR